MTDAVIEARQPEPGRAGAFSRTFLLPLRDVPEQVIRDVEHPMHESNVAEVIRDGVRRGLRHVGQRPVVDRVEQREDGLTAVTYALPVAPTDAAVGVSTSKRATIPAPPVVEPEPEFTADADEAEGDEDGTENEPVSSPESTDSAVPAPRHALDSDG